MTKAHHTLRTVLHRLGAAGPARVRASDGISASKIRLLVTLTATAAFFAFPGMAFAASPEPSELHVEPVFATTAMFKGVVNPKATEPVEAGTYQFLYRESTKKECKGTGQKRDARHTGRVCGGGSGTVHRRSQGFETVE